MEKKRLIKKNLLFTIGFVLLSVGLSYAQPYVDTPDRGNLPHSIDTVTPLNQLIARFESDWELRETEKAYWIGYTDDMYSIAAHKEAAIQPLLDFIERTKSDHAKYGAVLTIHLIGIKRKVVGRFYEEFKNKKAREALLSLLSKEELQIPVTTLLMRDPWPSDVPHLLKILQSDTPNAWVFVKALQRYKVNSAPVHQELPEDFAKLEYKVEWKDDKEYHNVFLNTLSNISGGRLIIEPSLLEGNLWGDVISGTGYSNGTFDELLHSLTDCDYTWLGSKIEYYYEDGKVYLCSIETARKRWLDWYERQQGLEYKE